MSKYVVRLRKATVADLAHLLTDRVQTPRLRRLLHRAHRDGSSCCSSLWSWRNERRRVVHINVTDVPTAQWTAQQLVEAYPWETAPRYLLRDRDAVYEVAFSRRTQSMGIHEVKTAPRSPWQNPYVERLIGTLRRECLDHVVVLNESLLRHLLSGVFHLLPRGPQPPLPGEGRPGATTGGAP